MPTKTSRSVKKNKQNCFSFLTLPTSEFSWFQLICHFSRVWVCTSSVILPWLLSLNVKSKGLENKLLPEADHSQSSIIGYMTELKIYTSLAKTSKNKQIHLEELQSIYQRIIFTRLCQQRQEVNLVRRQVFCKTPMASGWKHYFITTPFSNFPVRLMANTWLGKRPCSNSDDGVVTRPE